LLIEALLTRCPYEADGKNDRHEAETCLQSPSLEIFASHSHSTTRVLKQSSSMSRIHAPQTSIPSSASHSRTYDVRFNDRRDVDVRFAVFEPRHRQHPGAPLAQEEVAHCPRNEDTQTKISTPPSAAQASHTSPVRGASYVPCVQLPRTLRTGPRSHLVTSPAVGQSQLD
jgi:hypothetical protein